MQEIMRQVNELFNTLVAKNKDTDARDAKLRAQAEEQEGKGQAQEDIAKDLKEREAKVEKVENILATEQRNKGMLSEIMHKKEKLAEEIAAYNTRMAKNKAEIEQREKGLADDFKTLKDREAKLAEGQKKLAEDRKNLREQVIKEIASGIK